MIVFGGIIAGMKANKRLSPIVTEFFFNRQKTHFNSLLLISQSYFKVP